MNTKVRLQMKSCNNCKWEHKSGCCGHPRVLDLVTGEPVENWRSHAPIQRRAGWLKSIGGRMCGKAGHWFEPLANQKSNDGFTVSGGVRKPIDNDKMQDRPPESGGSTDSTVFSLQLHVGETVHNIDSNAYYKLKASGLLWELYPDAPDIFPSQNSLLDRKAPTNVQETT